jgi:hypothetical protein
MAHRHAKHTVRVAHHHPGRVRIRSNAFQGEGSADGVVEALRRDPAIESVEHSPITGSVLVRYVPAEIDADTILARAADTAHLVVGYDKARDPSDLTHQIIRGSKILNDAVTRLTGHRTDIRGILPLTLAGLSGYAFVTGKDRLPRWDALAFWAFSIFTQLHEEEIREATRGSTDPPGGEGPEAAGHPGATR